MSIQLLVVSGVCLIVGILLTNLEHKWIGLAITFISGFLFYSALDGDNSE